MSHPDMQRLEELLDATLAHPAGERDAFMDRTCGSDGALRRELGELLRVHDPAAAYFDGLAGELLGAAPLELESAARPMIQVGPYRALEAVGHGGMGVVYRAERVDGAFDREVALKLLHRDMETPHLRARFVAERQLLARLSHPNIAHLLDGGVTDEGRPFFVMEYVEGRPITQYCAAHALSIEQVLRLFLVVIEAVSYLHRNLVVHRDLKPSNILVDRDGTVKLLDFGIAKLLTEDADGSAPTLTGERLMTPEYAAPEQLAGAPVTTATDVFALGVVLFELLTSRRPHDRTRTDPPSLAGSLPPTPSSVLRPRRKRSPATPTDEGCAQQAGTRTMPWQRVDHDLDTICLAALRPEPEARYASAEQLGQDIERYLQGQPIRARKSTLTYRALRFAQRHRRGVWAAAALLVLVIAGFAHERWLRSQAEQARAAAQIEAAKAGAVSGFLADILSSADPMKAQGREVTVADVLAQASAKIAGDATLGAQPAVEAAVRLAIGNTYLSLGKLDEARGHLERAVELRGGLDARGPEALAAISSLGDVYTRLDLYARAEPILRKVLEVRVQTLGQDHPASLAAMNQLGDLLWVAGKRDEVEQLDRKTLEIRRRVLGEDHPDTLKSLNAVAGALFERGAYADAATLYDEAHSTARRVLGGTHPHTLSLGSNLAAAYLELGQYPKAEALLREIVDAKTRVFGPEHADTAVSVHNLGVTLAQQARYEEASEQLLKAIAVRARLPGTMRDYNFSRSYLADVCREQGRLEEAEALYLTTMKDQRDRYGPEDPETLKTIGGLAELRRRQGNLGATESLLAQILEPQARTRGEGHPDTLESLTTLARVRNQQRRFAEASTLAGRAIEAGARALGADHLAVMSAAVERARALAGQDQAAAAQDLAVRVHEVRARLLGTAHPATVEASRLLSELRTGGSLPDQSP
ncbi:MAG: serine/threonine-protein kinase [Thermoanaerobaculaceae bacterium]|jgi:serine/threonine-protein kinase|nr:serine/threonine-protein kinase [Thermoanaerobaculaceae bacterium]